MRCRILVLARHTPLPWEDGAGSYLFDILEFLKMAGCEIHVVWLAPHESLRWKGIWTVPRLLHKTLMLHMPQSFRVGRRYCFPNSYWLPRKARILGSVRRFLEALGVVSVQRKCDDRSTTCGEASKKGVKWTSLPTATEREYAREIAHSIRPHFAIASYPWMIPLFDVMGSSVRKRICLHYDIAWQRADLNAQISGDVAELSCIEEAELLARSDVIVDISERDCREVKRMLPGAETLVAPRGFVASPVPDPDSRIVLFVGSGNAFNIEGLNWLLTHVWPIVQNAHCEVELHVCGSINQAFQAVIGGVRFFGIVEDLSVHYAEAALVVVPLRRATGQNIKVVEAAAFGKPIVATSITVNSIPELKEAVVCVDEPNDFAGAINRLLENPLERGNLGCLAAHAINMYFGKERCYGPILRWLRHAL